ncbi:MAG: Asp-tRNA(Asn)/Glu-tRNA(Gln) amidotransferase subunit GatC [Chthonomonadales bacterium]|nr:Asp-tRNA(Asn)/Glu-tRNA(Gln) amidotransferase subunit GatC [Chthonomonadales bacterium]
MALTPDDVRKVALLARLELDDDEIERQSRRINELMARFEALQQIDVTGVEPTFQSVPMCNVLREDEPRPSLHREELLANAPESRDGLFIVPRILGD